MEGVGALLAGCPTAGLAGGLGVTVCAAAGGVLLYKIARRKKPTHMTVNCWFCNQDTVVPYGNRNCWDCPNCEQYNGFQENGDYNKPIPAQYMEHLNHVVSGAGASYDPTKPQQWVSSQLLLCKKCNNHQTMKIKQLASFLPREEGKYDEEIEVYKHYLEQTYKLCRPCQAAVEYYIKHQNRQLRALLLNHHFSFRKTDKTYMQSFYAAASASTTTPLHVIALRFLAFVSCAVLIAMALYGSGNPFSPEREAPSAPSPAPAPNGTRPVPPQTAASPSNDTLLEWLTWQEVTRLFPEQALETLSAAWAYGKTHQTVVVVLGLLTCGLAMLLAGRVRLRRIDAFASFLWLLVMGFHLAEDYLQADTPSWLDTAKFGATSLCCLVGFAAAVATRKPTGQRRPRPRRFRLFVQRKPPAVADVAFQGVTLISCVPSPVPSPAPSVAGSVASSSGSLRYRRPLISPARLNLKGQRLLLFPAQSEAQLGEDHPHPESILFASDLAAFSKRNLADQGTHAPPDVRPVMEAGSICSNNSVKRGNDSSHSSSCVVDTTTKGEELTGWRGRFGHSSVRGLLAVSLTVNLLFTSAYLYQSLR
ncbi:hypothetical protein lerEdw1_003184 [Lerista edwardsae]|nr:hypothetical protein lerEdw1_003184 [Lerista edwardsae]